MKAESALRKVSRDERKWAEAYSREIGEMDRRSGLASAEARGEAKAKLEIARKMKAMGIPVEQTALATGLSRETVERL